MALDYDVMGKRLIEARIKKGYTQEKLSEILNLSIAYISRVENGKAHINLKRLSQFCTELDTTEVYILGGVSSDSSSYLNNELRSILEDCSANDKKLFYKILTVISDNKSGS